MDKKPIDIEKKSYINARTVLWYVVFFGFAVNYMVRINLNIAIVSMVKTRPKSNISLTSECIVENVQIRTDNSSISLNLLSNNTQTNTTSTVKKKEFEGFDWNEYEQGLILGAFFWLHWLTQIPGGILANKYGAKKVFGFSNFAGVLFTFLIPPASFLGYKELIIVRMVQGLLLGFAWPAMHNMTAKWIPPNERSKFVTAYLGSSVGAAMTFPMCGYVIDTWGWELAFHICGILGTVWFIAWWCLVFDSPAEHPRISTSERDYIITSLGQSVSKEKAPVPWKALLTSIPVWMNILAQWGGIWGLFTLMTHAPTYFKMIHGWNIKTTGFLSGLPHLLRMVWAYIFSQFGDYLLRTNSMSRTNVRKLATAVCCIGQAFCMLALSYSGCDYASAIIFLTAATAIHGAVSTGPLASLVDLSPNYASIMLGFCNSVVAMTGFIIPAMVGRLTLANQTVAQWQKVFWIAAGMLLVPGILYVLFAKSELQSWNSPNYGNAKNESEMVTLKNGKAKSKREEDEEQTEKMLSPNGNSKV